VFEGSCKKTLSKSCSKLKGVHNSCSPLNEKDCFRIPADVEVDADVDVVAVVEVVAVVVGIVVLLVVSGDEDEDEDDDILGMLELSCDALSDGVVSLLSVFIVLLVVEPV
jgi:hypothetical protein